LADDLPADHAERGWPSGFEIIPETGKGDFGGELRHLPWRGEDVKAELNMVTREGLLKGGVDGVVVVPFKDEGKPVVAVGAA
jgi:hypothetical protein